MSANLVVKSGYDKLAFKVEFISGTKSNFVTIITFAMVS